MPHCLFLVDNFKAPTRTLEPLHVTVDFLRLIQLLQVLLLLLRQRLPRSTNRLVQTLLAAEANDGTGHALVDPRQRNVRHGPASLVGNLHQALDDLLVDLRLTRLALLLRLARAPLRRPELVGPASQVAPAQRRPRDQPDARVVAEPVHLALLLAVQQVVVVLHADKRRPPATLRHELHPRKLRRPHAAGPNVPHLAALDQVVERLHRLLDGRAAVEAVDLQQVDVRGVEAAQGGVDLVEDGRTGETELVLVVLGRLKLGAVRKVTGLFI